MNRGERREQGFEVGVAVVPFAIDEEGGGAVHATASAGAEILANAGLMGGGPDFRENALGIKTELVRVIAEGVVIERVLIFVQEIVHFPKFVAGTGGFGGL